MRESGRVEMRQRCICDVRVYINCLDMTLLADPRGGNSFVVYVRTGTCASADLRPRMTSTRTSLPTHEGELDAAGGAFSARAVQTDSVSTCQRLRLPQCYIVETERDTHTPPYPQPHANTRTDNTDK